MGGWHPDLKDGGLLPNPHDPGNPSQAFNPMTPPTMASPLYYGNGCDVRLRPHVLNSLISENLSLLDRVGLAYQPGSLWNTRTAIEYIVQKGLPKFTILAAQGDPPYYYRGILDPPVQPLNNGMVLCVVPTTADNSANRGFVRIDVGNGWWVPVLRNDFQELEREDWPANVPQLIGYYNGAFFMLGICKSQVPIVLKGAINFWIRWDGNDDNDGMYNTPQRAFRTIDGAWYAVGSRYAGSPGAAIYLTLGIPGDYDGCSLGPFGSTVVLRSLEPSNHSAYRVLTKVSMAGAAPGYAWSVYANGINAFGLEGITMVMNYPYRTPNGTQCLRMCGSLGSFKDCMFAIETDNPFGHVFLLEFGGGTGGIGRNLIRGNGRTIDCGWRLSWGATRGGTDPALPTSDEVWENLHFGAGGAGFMVGGGSVFNHVNTRNSVSNCTGRRYWIGEFSSITAAGQPIPGNQPGYVQPGGGLFVA